MTEIQKWLFLNQDIGYKVFHSKLIPNVDAERIVGVRIPCLRKYANSFSENERDSFLRELPHFYYEENNIHAFLIERIKDHERVLFELDRFLPFVDNWATCDSMRPKALSLFPQKTLEKAFEWMDSEKEYTIRYGVEVLMNHYLGDNYDKLLLKRVADIKSRYYYVNMMCAWYFATAMVDHFEDVIELFDNIDPWVRAKAISKARESYRISIEKKTLLKEFK